MFLRREVCNSAGSKRCSACKNEISTNSCHDSAWSRMRVSRAADCYRMFFAILLLTIWLEKWDLRLDDQCQPRPKNHPKITCGFISLILGNRFLQHGGQFFRILGTNSKGRDPGMGLLQLSLISKGLSWIFLDYAVFIYIKKGGGGVLEFRMLMVVSWGEVEGVSKCLIVFS